MTVTSWLTGVTGWTGEHTRHVAAMVRQDRNPAARVYESIGSDFFLALSPGWLNLGLWDGTGSEAEAETACRRLVAGLLRAVLPGAAARRRADHLRHRHPALAAGPGRVHPAPGGPPVS